MLVTDLWFPNDICPPITKSADYAITLADRGQTFNMNKASAINLTLPKDATQAIPIGSKIRAFQGGAGQLTFVAESGASVFSETGNLTTQALYSTVIAEKIAANTWVLSGAGLTVTSNVIARDATDLTVANTTAKSTAWSVAVAASKLGLDKTIVFEIGIEITIGNATNAITVTVDFGGTTMYADVTAGTTAVVGVPHPMFLRFTLSEHGGITNSQVLGGHISMGTAATTTTGKGDLGAIIANGTGFSSPISGAASVDSTASQNFVVSLTMSAGNNVANTWTRKNAIAYMLGEGQKGDSTVGPQGIAGTGTGTFPTSPNSPQSGNYTLQSSDIGQRLAASTSSTQTITVPNNSTLAMTDGQMFGIHVSSTGVVTVAGSVGVTLHPSSIVSSRQDGVIWVVRMDSTNNFLVLGDFL